MPIAADPHQRLAVLVAVNDPAVRPGDGHGSVRGGDQPLLPRRPQQVGPGHGLNRPVAVHAVAERQLPRPRQGGRVDADGHLAAEPLGGDADERPAALVRDWARSQRNERWLRWRPRGCLALRIGGSPHDAAIARDDENLAGRSTGRRVSHGDVDNGRCRAVAPQSFAGEGGHLHAHGTEIADHDLGRAVAVEIGDFGVADSFVHGAAGLGIGCVQSPRVIEHEHVLASAAACQPPSATVFPQRCAEEPDARIRRQVEFVSAALCSLCVEFDDRSPAIEGHDPWRGCILGRIEADDVTRQCHAIRSPGPFQFEPHGLPPRGDHLFR